MSIDIIAPNNALSHLNQVKNKRELSDYIVQDTIDDDPDFSPAYIVELSDRGKQLQRDHPVKIVRL
ncbi:hypothetical protein SOV_49130 [Sporomusa ovata DSM 2662]|uniref:Uncharacterized protein n=1 Tax=Sporomusa ovata TaxID=2378 RepID=A0A0U1L0D1_9FIRM|nr:hypothetical protein [Sporomusa ovata]EQB27287.1 hypothetical protein SOV_2c01820 [Sporomusa ovata DSM 2662]CQR73128.1 hypothetical protein SpAn4DRAFT_2360 [Sporomusa ovata]